HDVRRLRREFAVDCEGIRAGSGTLVPGRDRTARTVVRVRVLRAIKEREAGPAGGSKELLRGLDGPGRIDAAGVRVLFVDLDGQPRPPAIDEIVKIDRQQRRPRADEGLPAPAGIEPQIGFRDHVLPTVLVELFDGCHSATFRNASGCIRSISGSVSHVEAGNGLMGSSWAAVRAPAWFAKPGMRRIVALTCSTVISRVHSNWRGASLWRGHHRKSLWSKRRRGSFQQPLQV